MKLGEYAGAFRTVALERADDGILTARLHYRDGPLKWTALAHREFPRLLEAVNSDEENRVLVLTGTGDSFMSTPDGYGEVYRTGSVMPSDWERGFGEASRMLYGLTDSRVPVVAAVNGPVTGHCELVLLCDLVLCTPGTYFRDDAHVAGGLVPGDGMHVLWPLVLGPVRARHFLMAGQAIGAAEAAQLGIAGEIVEPGQLLTRAGELARRLAAVDPLVLRHTRELLYRPVRQALMAELAHGLGIEAYVSLSRSPQFGSPPGPAGPVTRSPDGS